MTTSDLPDTAPDASAGILDPVDYIARGIGATESEVQAALGLPRFRAAVAGFASGLTPLGYPTFFCWPDIVALNPTTTPGRLMDLIRYVARRSRIPATDPRYIAIDRAWARATYPELFVRALHGQQQSGHDGFLRQMGDFAKGHPWRERYFVMLEGEEHEDYVRYWLRHARPRIDALLADRRFMAAFDAAQQGIISYGGLVEYLYGDANHQMFPDLTWHLTGVALRQLVEASRRGEVKIPAGLQDEYPEFYRFYKPELHGSRSRS